MKGVSFITLILIIAVFGVFFYAVSRVYNPFDFYFISQDDKRKADLLSIQKALEVYYKENSAYPISTGNTDNPCDGSNLIKNRNPNTKDFEPVRWGTKWFGYLEPLPKDPNWNKCYVYVVSPTRQSYWLYTALDRGSTDKQACGASGILCNYMIGNNLVSSCHKNGGSEKDNCNYGLSSTNESL